ncbi:hypothetical protein EYF80_028063 [Liparis tanakae]|uniref:Uncharacterized protein n=1 Tax=Liparis tanakae TaxID=230148 RepID=A0A4Z2H7S7_9TELE|nr:hypothetical protein EYF80_028063 [Liparis tanakae]
MFDEFKKCFRPFKRAAMMLIWFDSPAVAVSWVVLSKHSGKYKTSVHGVDGCGVAARDLLCTQLQYHERPIAAVKCPCYQMIGTHSSFCCEGCGERCLKNDVAALTRVPVARTWKLGESEKRRKYLGSQ